jgi:TRAP-type uncharacterized transport system fused permease subunit
MLTFGHLLIPLFILIGTLILGYTPRMASGIALLAALLVCQLKKNTRLNIWEILELFEEGASGILIVMMATATAGMIVGVLDLTDLGQRLGAGLMNLAGGKVLPALVLSMLLAMLLGMGMPTAAAYIVQASTVIPALIMVGIPIYAAHMFAFYYACLSLITPPVAITSYAAAGIANSSMSQTGWLAFRLGFPAYIVPFMFIYGQSLMLVGTLGEILSSVATALAGVSLFAVFNVGYLIQKLNWPERIFYLIGSVLLIAPSIKTSFIGVFIGLFLLFTGIYRKKRLSVQ